MKINTIALIADLEDRTHKATALVQVFQKLAESQLRYKENPNTWSVLECIAHLNRYYAFYLPLLQKAIHKEAVKKGSGSFRSGWLGQFFVKLMEPKEGKIKKMKAMAVMNPNGTPVDAVVLQDFIANQEAFLQLLEACRTLDLNAVSIPTVMSRWITINLGDTLRFMVVHHERHLLQAQNCLKIKNFSAQG